MSEQTTNQKPGRPGYRFIALCKPLASSVLLPMVTHASPFGIAAAKATICLAMAREELPDYVREQHEGCEHPIKPEFRDPNVWEIAIAEVVVRSTHNYKDASK